MAQGWTVPSRAPRWHAWLGGVEHQVVQPVVAMARWSPALVAGAGGHVAGSHFMSLSISAMGCGDGGLVLLAPAADLASKKVAGLP